MKYFNRADYGVNRRTGCRTALALQEKALGDGESISDEHVKELWARHSELVRLVVLGWKDKDIAGHLGVSLQNVRNVKMSPIVQRKIAIMSGARDAAALDVSVEIRNMAPRALAILSELMETSGKDNVKLSAAQDILDRAGYGAPKRIEAVNANLTFDEIMEMRKRMEEAYSSGSVINAEVMDG